MPNPGTQDIVEVKYTSAEPPPRSNGQNLLRFWNDYKKYIITLISVVFLFVIGQRFFSYLLGLFFEWVEAIGIWGNFLFIFMFLVVSFPVVLGGYIPLTMGAGSIYGVFLGTITVSIGSTVGGIVAFWSCKWILQKYIDASKLKETSQFQLFQSMLNDNDDNNSLFVTLLARWAPMPFGLQNIFFVLADIPFRTFVLVTWIGLLPLQILYTYFGTTLRNISKVATGEVELDYMQKISLVFQVVVVIALVSYFIYLSKKIKRKQRNAQIEEEQQLEILFE